MNHVFIRPIRKHAPYELYKGRKPNTSHLYVFGNTCFVLNSRKDSLGKYDDKPDKALFLGYFTSSKTFRFLNKIPLSKTNLIKIDMVYDGGILEDKYQDKGKDK